MVVDYFTKPLQGQQFTIFRDMIMGIINDMSDEHARSIGTEHTTTCPGIAGTETNNGKEQTSIAKADMIAIIKGEVSR